VSKEVIEAARLDGAGDYVLMTKIIWPLMAVNPSSRLAESVFSSTAGKPSTTSQSAGLPAQLQSNR
ncbi:hypothetical protein, partial [Mesorhizobium sp. M7A.F.Ca.US.011.01.1.1]